MTNKDRIMGYPIMKKFYSVESDSNSLKEMLIKEGAVAGEPFRSLSALSALGSLAITSKILFDDGNVYEKDSDVREAFKMASDIIFGSASNTFKNPIEQPKELVPGCFTKIILDTLGEITSGDTSDENFGQRAYYVACFTGLGSIFEFLHLEKTDEKVLTGLVKLIEDFNVLGVKFFEDYLEEKN